MRRTYILRRETDLSKRAIGWVEKNLGRECVEHGNSFVSINIEGEQCTRFEIAFVQLTLEPPKKSIWQKIKNLLRNDNER